MKSILSNCRWLTLESEVLGKDWSEKAQEIDENLEGLGMDLAEETVFLLFDRSPGAISAGEGRCRVARSVIGPKRRLEGPLELVDWIQAPVHQITLKVGTWTEVLNQCYKEWENLQRQGHKPVSPFMILVKRRLEPELELKLEVLFGL